MMNPRWHHQPAKNYRMITYILELELESGCQILKKILCVKLFGHQLRMPASINVFLWCMYVMITGV